MTAAGEAITNNLDTVRKGIANEVERQTGYTPIIAIIDNELALEALNKNIIIKEDPFRTGFECKGCDGEGHKNLPCKKCAGAKVVAKNPEYNAAAATLTEKELEALPPTFAAMLRRKRDEQAKEVIDSGGLIPCKECVISDKRGGAFISGFEKCDICKGMGSSIVVPDEAIRRPTSGTVVGVGPLCTYIKDGDRVVYSNMMGSAINFKHNVILRVMREDEILIRLHGTKPEEFQKKLSR